VCIYGCRVGKQQSGSSICVSMVAGSASNRVGHLYVYLWLQGRQAIEWVISRLKEETQDLGRAARSIEMEGLKGFTQHKTSL